MYTGPKIVKDNLLFYYDTGNSKSYLGEPTINKVGSLNSFDPLDLYTWSTGGYQMTSVSRDTTIKSPLGGIVLRAITNGVASYSNSYNNSVTNITTASIGQIWTCSIYVMAPSGTSLTLYFFEANSSGGYTVFSTAGSTGTGSWQRISVTRTLTQVDTVYLQARFDIYTSDVTVYYSGLQVEQNSHATTFTSGTRSVTQGLSPLLGNTLLNLTNMSYDSNAQLTFNGTSNYFNIEQSFGVLSQYTIEYVSYTTVGNRMPIAGRTNTAFYKYGDNSWFYTHGGVTGEFYHSTSPSFSGYIHYVITYDGANVRVWRNNNFAGSQASTGSVNFSDGFKIGYWTGGAGYFWNGTIPIMKIYNKALTSNEVSQNYNALRTRFNI